MSQVVAPITVEPKVSVKGSETQKAILTFFLILICSIIALWSIAPPSAAPENTSLLEFSSARAMKHLNKISNDHHPLASAKQREGRDYILAELRAMGLDTELQTSTSINQDQQNYFLSGTVDNIIARIKGSDSGKTVLLISHYDSVRNSPSASDTAGAAAMLETARALKASPQPKNDITLLFADAGQVGQLGLDAFFDKTAWVKDIGVVLNFEARGTSGPAIMHKTNPENAWLVSEYGKASAYPVANSFFGDVSKLLSIRTRLNAFSERGISGLDFSFIDGYNRYNTALDSPERFSEQSLQHLGMNNLSLARHFGEIEVEANPKGDAVYFNTIGSYLIRYPAVLVLPLSLLILGLFLLVIYKGLNSKELTVKGLGIGVMAYAVALVIIPAVIWLLWWMVKLIKLQKGQVGQAELNNSKLYMAGFVAAAIAMMGAMYVYWRRKAGEKELAAGGLVWIAVAMIVMSVSMKGGSYLVSWPMMMSVIGMWYWMRGKEKGEEGIKQYVVMMISAIPALFLIVPALYLFYLAMTVKMSGQIMIGVLLLLGLLIPQINFITRARPWVLPTLSAVVAATCLLAGILSEGFDKDNPKPDSVFYVLNADTGKALWATTDTKPDEWTTQFLSNEPEKGSMSEFFPSPYEGWLKNQAPSSSLAGPNVTVVKDEKSDSGRTLQLNVSSPRSSPAVAVYIYSDIGFHGASINGKRLVSKIGNRWLVEYYSLPGEGIMLDFEIDPAAQIRIKAVDFSYGLPDLPEMDFTPRPSHIVQALAPYSDMTLVSKSYKF